jgi:hypothetical protein
MRVEFLSYESVIAIPEITTKVVLLHFPNLKVKYEKNV